MPIHILCQNDISLHAKYCHVVLPCDRLYRVHDVLLCLLCTVILSYAVICYGMLRHVGCYVMLCYVA